MRWERRPVLDEYDEDGRRAIYLDDHVVVVSELAVTVLDALPADESTIADVLVERHGAPPGDLRQAVANALSALVDQGLVNSSPTGR